MRLATLAFLLAASTAQADTFSLSLGGDPIGTLTTTRETLRSDVNNSPLGVADGVFDASARQVRTAAGDVVLQYLGKSVKKGRTISVLFDAGRALETTVSPTSEETELSDPAAVPAGVTNPVDAMQQIVNARGCPGTITFYDGRRVIAVTPAGSTQTDGTLTCDMSYRVTAGPGHLSPLYISRASLTATYATGGSQSLQDISISSGLFSLYMTR